MIRRVVENAALWTALIVGSWAIAYTAVSLQGIFTALSEVNRVTHFTHWTIAHSHVGVYAFVGIRPGTYRLFHGASNDDCTLEVSEATVATIELPSRCGGRRRAIRR